MGQRLEFHFKWHFTGKVVRSLTPSRQLYAYMWRSGDRPQHRADTYMCTSFVFCEHPHWLVLSPTAHIHLAMIRNWQDLLLNPVITWSWGPCTAQQSGDRAVELWEGKWRYIWPLLIWQFLRQMLLIRILPWRHRLLALLGVSIVRRRGGFIIMWPLWLAVTWSESYRSQGAIRSFPGNRAGSALSAQLCLQCGTKWCCCLAPRPTCREAAYLRAVSAKRLRSQELYIGRHWQQRQNQPTAVYALSKRTGHKQT